jgi:nucleotide-binding universal stress UspA family protein
MFKHILLPTDGSEMSDNAARVAIGLAKPIGARVTAIHFIPPYSLPVSDGNFVYVEAYSPDEYRKGTEQFAAEILARVQAEAKKQGVACETAFVTAGAPWDAIIKEAQARKCDLVVMASHGRKGLAGVLLGSETNKVLTHSTLPVLVTR